MRYEFDFDQRYGRLLAALGVTRGRAFVTLDGGEVTARFGPWLVRTPVTNIAQVSLTGPYRWFRVIGTHLSLKDRGISLGTNTRQGVCLALKRPVPGIDPRGLIKHPGLTVTVADPPAFAAAVRSAAGIPG